jgi:hypothetical protein
VIVSRWLKVKRPCLPSDTRLSSSQKKSGLRLAAHGAHMMPDDGRTAGSGSPVWLLGEHFGLVLDDLGAESDPLGSAIERQHA